MDKKRAESNVDPTKIKYKGYTITPVQGGMFTAVKDNVLFRTKEGRLQACTMVQMERIIDYSERPKASPVKKQVKVF